MSGRDGLHSLGEATREREVEEEEDGGRGVRGRVVIGADSRVLRPRGGRLAARRDQGGGGKEG